MRKIIYQCDRCRDEVEEDDIINVLDFDFCGDCAYEVAQHLLMWLGDPEEQEEAEELIEEPDEEEAEEPAEELSKRKNGRGYGKVSVDWNKACALRQAGWTYKDIGEELGIGMSTVQKYMQHYNMMEQYNAGKRVRVNE